MTHLDPTTHPVFDCMLNAHAEEIIPDLRIIMAILIGLATFSVMRAYYSIWDARK